MIAPELAENLVKLATAGKIPSADPKEAAAAVQGATTTAAAGGDPSTSAAGASASGVAAGAASTTAQLLQSSSASGLSLSESEAVAEAARLSQLRDLGFKQFGEALVRLATTKFPLEKLLHRRVRALLLGHVLPHCSQRAMTWGKQQQAAAANAHANAAVAGGAGSSLLNNAVSSNGGGGAGGSAALGPGGVAANLSTVEVDAVFRKYNALLRQVFQIYARITPQFMTMTFNVSATHLPCSME